MIDGGRIVSYLDLDTSGYQAALASATSQLAALTNSSLSAGQRFGALGGAMSTLGGTLTKGVTVPLLAAGTAAGAAAVSFESAFAGVRKTVNATEAEYAGLAQGLQDMSEQIPTSAKDLAGLMEIAGQLGVDKDNLLAFTETIANLSVTTNLSGEAAATMLAQYANIMQMPLDQIGNLGSVIVALGNNCATTEADIAAMAQRLAGTGNLLGLTNAEVMGLSATMASLGINAEAGGSAMSRTMQNINSAVLGNTEALAGFAEVAGMSVEEFKTAWQSDTMGTLDSFIAGIGRINEVGGDAAGTLADLGLGDLRITDTVLRMAGAEGELAANIQLANRAWQENNALQNEADQRYATTESQLQLAKNSVANMMTSLGGVLLPVIADGAEIVGNLADSFNSMDTATKKNIISIAGMAAAAGPLLKILGGAVTLLSGPGGWVTLLGAAGLAGAVAIGNMRRAAIQADLDRRFGDVTLSATELDQAMIAMLGRSTGYSAAWSTAGEETSKAVEALQNSVQTLDTLMVKASLGIDVSEEDLLLAVQQLNTDVKTAIEAERIKANLAIDTLFDTGDNEAQALLLAGRVGGYFGALEGEAADLGRQLAEAVEQGMADGFLDENEQATIQALRTQLQNVLQQAVNIESGSQLYRWRNQFNGAGLSPESITALLESSGEIYQGGLAEKQQARDYLKNLLSMDAAEGGWSQARYDAEAAVIDKQYEASAQQWAAEVARAQWDAIGGSIKNAYGAEYEKAGAFIEQAKREAARSTLQYMGTMGMSAEDDGYAEYYAETYKERLAAALSSGWGSVIDPTTMAGMQEIYKALEPTHDTLRALAESMGDDFPAELQSALQDMNLLEMMATTPELAGQAFIQNFDPKPLYDAGEEAGEQAVTGIESGTDDAHAVGEEAGTQVVSGMESGVANAYDAGVAGGQGFVAGLNSQRAAVAAAGAQLGGTVGAALREVMMIKSPSRLTRGYGQYTGQGFALGILDEMDSVKAAGTLMGETSVAALATAIDAHSPAGETLKQGFNYVLGFAEGIGDRLGETALGKAVIGITGKVGEMWNDAVDEVQKERDKKSKAAAAARARAAAAAEAARQHAILIGIQQTAAATLAADTAAYERRMSLIETQTQSLLDFAGSHAIWYRDDKGKTETEALKDYYNNLIEQEVTRYESQLAGLSTDAQREAAKAAYDDRIELLKEQRDAEVEALQKQYDLQKEMATDWLSYQQSLLSAELAAKRAAYAEDDYEDELATLKKKQRQSKSAREKRELQEQIDKMERDHALEQEEAALQETLAGYDALIEAVNAGLIGMGDLTGSTAFGDISFGTAGLDALDTLTSGQLSAVLGSLHENALSDGVYAAVSADQLAAALQSAASSGTVTPVVTREGTHYTIDLRGATVRDDSDIDRIVEELDKRLRAASR